MAVSGEKLEKGMRVVSLTTKPSLSFPARISCRRRYIVKLSVYKKGFNENDRVALDHQEPKMQLARSLFCFLPSTLPPPIKRVASLPQIQGDLTGCRTEMEGN